MSRISPFQTQELAFAQPTYQKIDYRFEDYPVYKDPLFEGENKNLLPPITVSNYRKPDDIDPVFNTSSGRGYSNVLEFKGGKVDTTFTYELPPTMEEILLQEEEVQLLTMDQKLLTQILKILTEGQQFLGEFSKNAIELLTANPSLKNIDSVTKELNRKLENVDENASEISKQTADDIKQELKKLEKLSSVKKSEFVDRDSRMTFQDLVGSKDEFKANPEEFDLIRKVVVDEYLQQNPDEDEKEVTERLQFKDFSTRKKIRPLAFAMLRKLDPTRRRRRRRVPALQIPMDN